MVPDWQRSYAWGSKEVEAFWLDLLSFDQAYPDKNVDKEEYFLGSAVLVTGGAENLLLDGQQRLATATILLSVLRDARRTYMADAATRLQNKYIVDTDDATGLANPVLTLNVYDREYFRLEVQDEHEGAATRPKPTLKSHGLIRRARDYFAKKITEEESSAGGGKGGFDRNLRISRVVCDHMSLVLVHSNDEDNAASVFETLNDRGIGLSTPDLLRNLLLRRAVGDEARRRIVVAWQTVLGIADESSVEDFLRHYWVSCYGDVKARSLYREIKNSVLEKNIDALDFSLDLADSALLYRELAGARDADKDFQRLLEGIRELGAKSLLPALLSGLSALSENDGKEGLRDLARALTSLFVRHAVVGGRESTALEARVYAVAADLRATKDFAAAIAAIQEFAPRADEFAVRFARASVSRAATARYLLREIEHAKRMTQEMVVDASDRVHLEHIYPQMPAAERWPNHAQMINRLGNLTLLSKRLNTSIKNADFDTKKDKGYTGSDIQLTKELLTVDSWSSESIEERQKGLSEFALKVWRFPGELGHDSWAASKLAAPSGPDSDHQMLEELPEVPE